ncbi:alpha/beta fold hydrolase [Salsipaludibacter albus]|uniref:alpha/beta fold hydrolase n=1 Tax=Salsipaludibacter albus TaxID=2849650 RepID=UPI001EE4DB22
MTTDDGVQLHVEVDGPTDATTTVAFVHGFAADAGMYEPQWTALRSRCRVVRFDQRGHGRSGWAGFRSATFQRLGRDLEQVIDRATDRGPVVLVGHSMGAMGLLALAGQRPELFGARVAGVALMSTEAGPLVGQGSGVVPRVRQLAAVAGAGLLWLAAPLLHALHPFETAPVRRLLLRRLFDTDPPDAAVRSVIRTWQRTPAAVMTAYLPDLTQVDQRAAAAALRDVPVLVLAGDADETIDPGAARRLAERIGPSARLVVVDGAGHMVTLTHAEEVNAALLDLVAVLDRTERSSDAGPRQDWQTKG